MLQLFKMKGLLCFNELRVSLEHKKETSGNIDIILQKIVIRTFLYKGMSCSISYLLATLLLSIISSGVNSQSYCFKYDKTDTIWPKIFCDTIRIINGISFSPDAKTLYTSAWPEKGKRNSKIFEYSWQGNKYDNKRVASFCIDNADYHPVVSPDGNKLFFNSKRPVPGTDTLNKKVHIWFVERKNEEWSDAVYLTEVNIPGFHNSYPSVARDGTLYFNSDRPGGKGGMDFYKSEWKNGKYRKPENISAINSTHEENDLIVDPDERFIIFNRGVRATGEVDMWITFKTKKGWSEPRRLEIINREKIMELTPALSPDGKFFLYESKGVIMYLPVEKLINTY